MESTTTESRIIRAKELGERLSVSRTTLWRWERAGLLPKRRRIGPNVAGWFEHEIDMLAPDSETAEA